MSQGPEKLSPVLWRQGTYYLHWCEACGCGHTYRSEPGLSDGRPNWSFNGNVEQPSFTPSMLIFTPAGPYGENEEQVPQQTVCHYFLTDGQISYCADSPHWLSGQTVPLIPIPDDYDF